MNTAYLLISEYIEGLKKGNFTTVGTYLNMSQLKEKKVNKVKTVNAFDFDGCYVIKEYNKKYALYVGQSQHVFSRMGQHLSGTSNNEELTEILKNRSNILLQFIPANLNISLNEQERELIKLNQSFIHGINKNEGVKPNIKTEEKKRWKRIDKEIKKNGKVTEEQKIFHREYMRNQIEEFSKIHNVSKLDIFFKDGECINLDFTSLYGGSNNEKS